jgi:nucleoside-diphosphate-sugar epimerase
MVHELVRRGYEVECWDVASGSDARVLFRMSEPVFDLVVHCAFHVGGRAAIDGEPRLLARNLELDAAMFDWAVRTGQRRVLYFSSSAAYPVGFQQGRVPYRLSESDIHYDMAVSAALVAQLGTVAPLMPDGRYGWAKLTGEHLARAAAESGLPVHVVRPFSGYGADQSLDYPFPSFIDRALRREDPFTIWGPGTQVRDWIHIDDVIAGALAVVDADHREPVNLCTGIGSSMLELAQLCSAVARYEPVYAPRPGAPTGVAYRVGDPTLLHRFYKPQVTLAEGIERAMGANVRESA